MIAMMMLIVVVALGYERMRLLFVLNHDGYMGKLLSSSDGESEEIQETSHVSFQQVGWCPLRMSELVPKPPPTPCPSS